MLCRKCLLTTKHTKKGYDFLFFNSNCDCDSSCFQNQFFTAETRVSLQFGAMLSTAMNSHIFPVR